jgi:uncharacterized delta-60 repeat protein
MRCLLFVFFLLPFHISAQVDGSLDSSFGANGIKIHALCPEKYSSTARALQIYVDKQDRVILGGISTASNGFANRQCFTRLLSTGKTDSSFGQNGRIYLDNNSLSNATLNSFSCDSLNRITISFLYGTGTARSFGLKRFLPNAQLDSSFGINGTIIYKWGAYANALVATSFLANGKIVLVGTYDLQTTRDLLVIRTLPNGMLDSTFADSGSLVCSYRNSLFTDIPNGLVPMPNGNLVIAGTSSNGTNNDIALLRLNENGRIDSSFGSNGTVISDFFYRDDETRRCQLAPDGGIIVYGVIKNVNLVSNNYFIKYLPNGALDNSFGVQGKFIVTNGANSFHTLADTTIIAFNSTGLRKYLKNGNLDVRYGNNGIFTFNSYLGYAVAHTAMAMNSTQKIHLAGYYSPGSNAFFSHVGVLPNGQIDYSLDSNGIIYIPMGDPIATPNLVTTIQSMSVQTDKKIVIAGSITRHILPEIHLKRFESNGSMDVSFGNKGEVYLGNGRANCIQSLSNKKMLVGGMIWELGSYKPFLCRIDENGNIDSTFGENGKVIIRQKLPGSSPEINDIDILPDGKIFTTGNGLMRFFSDGKLDSSFAQNGMDTSIYGNKSLVQADGKIVVMNSQQVSRYLANGFLDSTFATKGTYSYPYYLICVGPDILSHYTFYEPQFRADSAILIRGANHHLIYNSGACESLQDFHFLFSKSGQLISSYGTGGKSIHNDGSFFRNTTLSLGYASMSFVHGPYYYYLSKYNENGLPDNSFGINGRYNIPQPFISAGNTIAFSNKIDSNKILMAMVRNDSLLLARHWVKFDETLDYTISPRKVGSLKDTFYFHALSTGKLLRYQWVIPHAIYLMGTDSSSANPIVKFTSGGYKSIQLHAFFEGGKQLSKGFMNEVRINDVQIGINRKVAEVLDFVQVFPTSYTPPANFKWKITGAPKFANSFSETSISPLMQFHDTGVFDVQVTTNFDTKDSMQVEEKAMIRIVSLQLTSNKYAGKLNDTFQLALIYPIATNFVEWRLSSSASFVNGTTNYSHKPHIKFLDTGWFDIELLLRYGANDSIKKVWTKFLYVSPTPLNQKPSAAFMVNKIKGTPVDVFHFFDESAGFPDQWSWSFSPNNVLFIGSNTQSQNPQVSFLRSGSYNVSLRVANLFGSDSLVKSSLINIFTTGVHEDILDACVIYPNPANDVWFIQGEQEGNQQLEVFNHNGQLVKTWQLHLEPGIVNELSLADLAPGFYFIQLTGKDGTMRKTMIIAR